MAGEFEGGYQAPGETEDSWGPVVSKEQSIDPDDFRAFCGNKHFSGTLIAGLSRRMTERFFWCLWQISQNGHVILETKDTVAVLVYNPDKRAVALVGQCRPAVSLKDGSDGMLIEVLAGHIEDEDINNPKAAMAREAIEEMGAKFDPDNTDFELICTWPLYLTPGHSTERMYLGYIEAGDDMFDLTKTTFGVAAEIEQTQVRWYPIDKLETTEFEDMKTFALVQWFLRVKYPQIKSRDFYIKERPMPPFTGLTFTDKKG